MYNPTVARWVITLENGIVLRFNVPDMYKVGDEVMTQWGPRRVVRVEVVGEPLYYVPTEPPEA